MPLVDCLATDERQPSGIICQFLQYREVTRFILGLVYSTNNLKKVWNRNTRKICDDIQLSVGSQN